MKVEAIRLASGDYLARPEGAVGNIGWHPFPWTGFLGDTEKEAKEGFLRAHKSLMEKENDSKCV